jgi:hypothetical protein
MMLVPRITFNSGALMITNRLIDAPQIVQK